MINLINANKLYIRNPWWRDSNFLFDEKGWIRRDLYFELERNMEQPLALSILGLRRVGKSTILKQLINKLFAEGKDPKRIFYYLFDDLEQINTSENLDALLSMYFEQILQEPLHALSSPVYIFFDEIQYVPDWQTILKRYYDLSEKKIKFIISGSQSVLLEGKNKETMAGRIFDYYLPPLSFDEFMKIKEEKSSNDKIDLFDLTKDFHTLSRFNFGEISKMEELAREYVLWGQFPECLKMPQDGSSAASYIRESVVGKILQDIIVIYKIRKPDDFKIVAYYFINNSSSIFEVDNIAREVGISPLTINKYIKYLTKGYLMDILYKEHRTIVKRGRILKKAYATSPNFTSSINGYSFSNFDQAPEAFGKIMEGAVFDLIKSRYGNNIIEKANVFFWRNGKKEIDFIVSKGKERVPVEVKFSNNISLKELKPIVEYLTDKKIPYGVVVTKKDIGERIVSGQKLYFIPCHLFLQMF